MVPRGDLRDRKGFHRACALDTGTQTIREAVYELTNIVKGAGAVFLCVQKLTCSCLHFSKERTSMNRSEMA